MALLSPKQRQAWREAQARWNIFVGATGSGKTHVCHFLKAKRMRQLPPGNCLLVGKTERTYKRNVLDPMRLIFGDDLVSQVHGDGQVELFGRSCYLVGANDERAIQKIQGISLVYADCDEAATYPESFLQMLKSRLREPGACCDMTMNPESPYHHIKVDMIDRAEDIGARVFHFVLDDNPFLPPEFVAAIRAEYPPGSVWYQRYILGLWVAAEGAIYDMFDEQLHVVTELPNMVRYWVGVDYGTTNPTVFLLVGQGDDNCLYVVDEWRYDSAAAGGRQMTDQQYSAAFRQWIATHGVPPKWIFIDPSAASFIAQLKADKVAHLALADNAVLDGIRRVSTLVGSGRLKVHKRCKGLVKEVSGYVWDSKAQAKGEDKPVKSADHGPDALRYVINGTQAVWAPWIGYREAA